MESHSSHTNHELLTLVIGVTNVSFAIESFITHEKGLIMMLHMKRFFLLLKFQQVLYSLIWRIYHKLIYEKFCKNRSEKCDQNPQNTSKG